MTIRTTCLLPILLTACPPAGDTGEKIGDDTGHLDSGAPDDSGTTCDVHLTETTPASGAIGVYYRAPLTLSFDGDAAAAAVGVQDSAGAEVVTSVEWSEGNVQATVTAALSASTDYTLSVEICGATNTVLFSTSDVGTPLTGGSSSLLGKVYGFSLNEANITDPEILEALDDQFFTQPILFEVTQSDDATITLLGALGYTDGDTIKQAMSEETFEFPAADFGLQPYFYASTPLITISYSGSDIPINNFEFTGVFTADGGSIVYGTVAGLVDTRNLGPLLGGGDDPEVACDFAETYGIYCEACPDGEELCLSLVGDTIEAPYYADIDVEVVVE